MGEKREGTSHVQLSPHFNSKEFACRCCGVFQVAMPLVKALEELRSLVAKPLKISSGYRCATHNKKVGGSQSSEHVKGTAVDVLLPEGLSLEEFYSHASKVPGFKGIGVYPEGGPRLHLDVRSKRARWSVIDGKYVAVEAAFKKGNA